VGVELDGTLEFWWWDDDLKLWRRPIGEPPTEDLSCYVTENLPEAAVG
jgi:hypothetical protein